jgi:hypothetical protein
MRRSSAAFLLLAMAVAVAAVQVPSAQAPSPSVVYVTPEKINWKAVAAGLPPGAQIAVLAGDPASDGPFVLRLKMPDGYKIAPHRHPVTEITQISVAFLNAGD